MLSFWEKQTLPIYDFAVVGAGIMGLSVAFELRQKFPDATIAVFERGIFPKGASTRNAGFACFGSPTEILHDFALNGADKTIELITQRIEGLRILEERLGKENMGFTGDGGYELILDQGLSSDKITELNSLLFSIFKSPIFSDVSDKILDFGFSGKVVQLLKCDREFQIDSGKMMKQYKLLCEQSRIEVITGADIKNIEDNLLEIYHPLHSFSVKANKIFICTNAFVKELFPEINIQPGRGQVLITKPVTGLPFKGSFHFDEGFYYFRNVGERILFGGGRNQDMETENTTAFDVNSKIITDLEEKLRTVILPGIPFETDHTWQGIMGFADNKLPQVIQIDPNTTYVMACNGMGVALSPFIAQELVSAL